MLPVLNVGPLVVQTGGLILLLGVWLGLTTGEKAAPRFGVDPTRLYNLALIALVAGVLGARLAFAARHPQAFSGNPLAVLSPTPTMFDLGGGVLVGLIAGLIYGQRQRLRLWSTLDALTPAFAVFALAFGVMQLATGNGFGSPTNLPWGIELWGAVRHPT
ncbi:MAG TPA: prolipoprotein diacylglyceryl transferase family protein, partial [Anaerolineaceae bacterium]|nr:prolipoprotein diacylglyceryl transferase family protein [Anaerolineaceae bacterium]